MSTSSEIMFMGKPPAGERAYYNINSDASGKPRRNYELIPHQVPIEDIRPKVEDITLDKAGFQLFSNWPTAFINDGDVDVEGYYKESIDAIKTITGASRVEMFDHTIRRRRPDIVEDTPDKRQPVNIAHVDQTTGSATARVHRHLTADEAPKLVKKRFQVINLWRPITNPAFDWPLALCDYRSVDAAKDVQPVALIYPDREGETFGVKYNPNQRWGFFKAVRPDEFVLIKCFDSAGLDNAYIARFAPHTAFPDPNTPKDAPFRESIELRALVFYD